MQLSGGALPTLLGSTPVPKTEKSPEYLWNE